MEPRKNKGFRYKVEREKIAEYKRLPAGEKLKWLEDIFLFPKRHCRRRRRGCGSISGMGNGNSEAKNKEKTYE